MPITSNLPSTHETSVGTPTIPWRHVLPKLSAATPSTTVPVYTATEFAAVPTSDPATGVGVFPVRGINQLMLRFWSSEASTTARSVAIFGLRALEQLQSSSFTPPQTLGGVWLCDPLGYPTCTVGANVVGAGAAGLQANGDPIVARWIDSITTSTLDYTSNPPGMQTIPAASIQAGAPRRLQFDVTGFEHCIIFLPSGWNAAYTGI